MLGQEDTLLPFDAKNKYDTLVRYIASFGKAAVAVSGGADSSLLFKAAVDALHENAIPVAVQTEVTIKRELKAAKSLCDSVGVDLNVIDVSLLNNSLFVDNQPNRCYICKKAMFTAIKEFVYEKGIAHIIEGTNASDDVADRPGFVAIHELGVISPLRECGLTKSDVRAVSKWLGLGTWNAPSNSCMATRFPYGYVLTAERLSIVERAEDFLVANGLIDVRVRVGGHNA